MLVAYRDDGFWTQLWFVCSKTLTGGLKIDLPGPGFVGRGSLSFLDTGRRRFRLLSIRMRRTHSIYDAHLWRLTCVWEPYRRRWLGIPFGIGWALAGHLWVVAGAVASRSGTRTTST